MEKGPRRSGALAKGDGLRGHARVGHECRERRVGDPAEADVVDVPTGGTGAFIGSSSEPDLDVLISVRDPKIQDYAHEVRPTGAAANECRFSGTDRIRSPRIGEAVVCGSANAGPGATVVGADLDDSAVPITSLE